MSDSNAASAAATGDASLAPTFASRVRAFTDTSTWADASLQAVEYGPDLPTETDLKLLGPVDGKRVLELGGHGPTAVALARQGAKVVSVGPAAVIAAARQLAEDEGVRVEWHEGGLAELAFMRPDAIDVAVSIYALGAIDDISRVFRQVHRVLRTDAPLVLSVPHPAYLHADHDETPPRWDRPFFDSTPITTPDGTDYPRPASVLFVSLIRVNFRVDAFLEPAPREEGPRSNNWTDSMTWVPSTTILRARKLA